jgi:hypothetical protein
MRWEESLVEELAGAMVYPETPDMRAAVLSRVNQGQAVRPGVAWRLGLASAAVVAIVFALVVMVSRDARDAVAEFLGLAVEGEVIEILPTPHPGATATPFPTPVALETIATRVSRSEAEQRSRILLPASLGEPDAYYALQEGLPIVVIDYGQVQIWEMEYFADEYFIGKGIVGEGTVVQEVSVNGKPGYWVAGGERIVTVKGRDGSPVAGTQRTVSANALLWAEDRLYRRIEGAGTLEEAMKLAGEMR